MKCCQCDVDKLSEEFPPEPLSKTCKHPPYRCLRCTLKKLKEQAAECKDTLECPDCHEPVSSDLISQLRRLLEFVFPAETVFADSTSAQEFEEDAKLATGGVFHVNMLDGKFCEIPYNPSQKIRDLKQLLQKQLDVPVEKQRLVFKSRLIKSFSDDRKMTCVSDYEIKPGDQLYLMQLMYAIKEGSNLKHVIMKLQWNWVGGIDYLDGSALVFNGDQHIGIIDYNNRNSAAFIGVSALTHSGDVLERDQQLGQHTINVFLDKIPDSVTNVFFTLSAWDAPSMGAFRNQAVALVDSSNPDKTEPLGDKVVFSNIASSQALVMSRLYRMEGGWDVVAVGKTSRGNAKNYDPLVATIRNLPSL